MLPKSRFSLIKKNNSQLGLMILDVVILCFCSVVMFKLRNPGIALNASYQLLIALLILLTINVSLVTGLYKHRHGQRLDKEIANLFLSLILVILVISLFTFFTKSGESYSRLWRGLTMTSSFILMTGLRAHIWRKARNNFRSGINQTRVIIVGAGTLGELTCDTMIEESWAGYKPVALFSDAKPVGHDYKNIKVEGDISELTDFIEKQRQSEQVIHEVWIALPLQESDKIQHIQEALLNTTVSAFLVPDLMGFNISDYQITEAAGLPVIDLSTSSLKHSHAFLKRLEDIIISLLMLIVLSPVFTITAILLKMNSKESVFFKQRRYGMGGQEINVWKFRSMSSSDDGETVQQAKKNDPRVTKIGHFIRRYSIDELPQLFNVLNGTMSLVGPRPHAVAHNEFYRDKIHGYMSRHSIRPGMTGWAQVNGCRGQTETIEKMQRRIRYDIEYMKQWSILFDFRILLKTLIVIFKNKTTY